MVLAFSILSFAMIVVVYFKVKDLFGQYKHLSTEDFHAYKLDRMTHDERKRVTLHLGICEPCQQAMIDYDPDDMIEHLVE